MGDNLVISDFPEFPSQLAKLGLPIPTGIALLPNNIESANSLNDLLYASETPTIRVLWRNSGIEIDSIEPKDIKIPYLSQKSDDFILPTIFFAFSLWSQNPQLVSIALGVISNYLTDFFKGLMRKPNVKLEIVTQTSKNKYKRIRYEGPYEGMKDISKIIEKVESSE